MDVRIEERIEITRAPDEVWAFVADPANDPIWCRKVRAVEPAGDRRWKVWHQPVRLRPVVLLETEHVGIEAPTRLRIREEDDAAVFDIEYRLEATPAGTSFTQVSEFSWKKLPRPLQRIFAYGVRRDVAAQLRELKHFLETTSGSVA